MRQAKVFVWVLVAGLPLFAQEDFRRGDANVDGVVDISDAATILFSWKTSICHDAADVNDDGTITLHDARWLLDGLFADGPSPNPPGPDTPGKDPTFMDGLYCDSYDPTPPPKLADVALGWEGYPGEITGKRGELKTFEVFATLTTSNNSAPFGAQGWSAGFAVEGGTIKEISRDLPSIKEAFFQLARAVSPDDAAGGKLAVWFSIVDPSKNWPPREGTIQIAKITVEATIPESDEPVTVTLRFEEGLGQPVVRNVVTIDGTSQIPTLGSCTILLRPETGTKFHRGDPNGSGAIDIADAIYILNYLFASGPEPTCMESGDTDNSGQIDIADPIALLGYLFSQDPPPAEPGPPTDPCGTDPDPKGSRGDLGCELYERC